MAKVIVCFFMLGLVSCAGTPTKNLPESRSPDQVAELNCQAMPFAPPANLEGLLSKHDVVSIVCEAMRRTGLNAEQLSPHSLLVFEDSMQHAKFLSELKFAVNSFVKRDAQNMIGAYYNINLDFSSFPPGTTISYLLESVAQEQRVVYADQAYYLDKVEPNKQRAHLTPAKLKDMKNKEQHLRQMLELKKMKQKGQIN